MKIRAWWTAASYACSITLSWPFKWNNYKKGISSQPILWACLLSLTQDLWNIPKRPCIGTECIDHLFQQVASHYNWIRRQLESKWQVKRILWETAFLHWSKLQRIEIWNLTRLMLKAFLKKNQKDAPFSLSMTKSSTRQGF